MTKVCRTCLTEVKKFKNVFTDNISGLLSSITGLRVSVDDGLSEIICLDCTNTIKKFYDFREKCHKSYELLQSLKTEVQNSETVVRHKNFEKNTTKIEENENVSCKKEFPDLENSDSKSDDEYIDINSEDSQVEVKNACVTNKTDTIIEKKLKKKNREPHHCNVCSVIVENSKILKRHRESHDELNPRNYICELCHDAFYEKSKLIRHKRRHENLKKYTCEKCNDQFYDIGALVRHTEAIHADLQPIQCTVCNESFILERQYDHHMKKSHGVLKEYRCFQCNEIFTLPKMLLKHENTHKYGKPYPCSLCSVAFQNSKALKHHLKWHAGEGLQYIVCTLCGKQIERYRITKHMKVHGDKPFKCKICPRACTEKWELVNHMRIHTGEKRFICNFCGNRFLASQTLKKHLLIHTGEKPHVCTICGHAFRQHGTLKTHMKVHRQC